MVKVRTALLAVSLAFPPENFNRKLLTFELAGGDPPHLNPQESPHPVPVSLNVQFIWALRVIPDCTAESTVGLTWGAWLVQQSIWFPTDPAGPVQAGVHPLL